MCGMIYRTPTTTLTNRIQTSAMGWQERLSNIYDSLVGWHPLKDLRDAWRRFYGQTEGPGWRASSWWPGWIYLKQEKQWTKVQ